MYLHQLHFLEILFDIHSFVLKLYYFVNGKQITDISLYIVFFISMC